MALQESWRSVSGLRREREREGGEDRGRVPCRFSQQGFYRFTADGCRFSHDMNLSGDVLLMQVQTRVEETSDQQAIKTKHQSWRRILRTMPVENDIETAQSLWNLALELVRHGDRNLKQTLPRDLVDGENFNGFRHIKMLLGMRPDKENYGKFNKVARSFLLAITHPELLDCLSVDSYVGDIYNFLAAVVAQEPCLFS